MLDPAPTTRLEPGLARGVLEEIVEATATKPAFIVVSFHNTSYRMHLRCEGDPGAAVGKRIVGRIRADAKRVDVVRTGGRFVEPVIGRPRRVQGRVVSIDPSTNSVAVNAGITINCRLTDSRQKAADFEVGQCVSFDVLRGASLVPEG